MSDHAGPEVWHEAGHAVVAHWQGGVVCWVTIESDRDDHHGHTEVAWVGFDPADRARRSAMAALAGPVAELLEGDHVAADFAAGAPAAEVAGALAAWRGDWDEAEECLRLLEPRSADRDALRRRLVREIAAFLRDPGVRERLARVVDALDAHETLDAALFGEALG